MRSEFRFRGRLRVVAALVWLMASHLGANAEMFLSNLGNRFDASGSIGDIHGCRCRRGRDAKLVKTN